MAFWQWCSTQSIIGKSLIFESPFMMTLTWHSDELTRRLEKNAFNRQLHLEFRSMFFSTHISFPMKVHNWNWTSARKIMDLSQTVTGRLQFVMHFWKGIHSTHFRGVKCQWSTRKIDLQGCRNFMTKPIRGIPTKTEMRCPCFWMKSCWAPNCIPYFVWFFYLRSIRRWMGLRFSPIHGPIHGPTLLIL